MPPVPRVVLGLVFVSRNLLLVRVEVPSPTGRSENSHDAFGKDIQRAVSW